MPRLVDTTIRVLSQDPLAGLIPTAEILTLAEILDGAGFAYLEISGGGGFDTAVRRGVESPWERIRALKARTTTPLALALRGRFLVGSRPVAPRQPKPTLAVAAAAYLTQAVVRTVVFNLVVFASVALVVLLVNLAA